MTEGQLRALHRKVGTAGSPYELQVPYHTFRREDAMPLVPGESAELRFGLHPTSVLIRKGHRIRVQISGAFFPHLSRNLQTGELEMTSSETRDATITVHHDVDHPSRLILPIVER